MQTVKVNRADLLVKIKANRVQHAELFTKAEDGYRLSVIEGLEKLLAAAKESKVGDDLDTAVVLQEPIDRTGDYDRVIAMLEMCVDDTVELSANEFNNYVLDQWAWSQLATTTNSVYASYAAVRKH